MYIYTCIYKVIEIMSMKAHIYRVNIFQLITYTLNRNYILNKY